MKNIYFGKLDNIFILYIDPFCIDLIKFSKVFSSVYCNEIIFDNYNTDIYNNKKFNNDLFVKSLKEKQIIAEFNIVFDCNTHIQNVWWDDLLVISYDFNLEKIIKEVKNSMSSIEISMLKECIKTPNYYFNFKNEKIFKQKINFNKVIEFIKNSDRYQEKEYKFINSLEIRMKDCF